MVREQNKNPIPQSDIKTDNESLVRESQVVGDDPNLSRYDALRVGGVTVGVGLAARVPLFRGLFDWLDQASRQVAIEASRSNQLSPEAMLDYYRLSEYSVALQQGQRTEQTFGSTPPEFCEIYRILTKACQGGFRDPEAPELSALKYGWGEKYLYQAVGPAERHAGRQKIRIDADASDKQSEVRQFLEKAARSFPLHILTLPWEMSIHGAGGIMKSKSPDFGLTTFVNQEQGVGYNLSIIQRWFVDILGSIPGNSQELAKVKPYIRKVDFANYVYAFYFCMNNLADHFLSQPEAVAVAELGKEFPFDVNGGEECQADTICRLHSNLMEWCNRFRIPMVDADLRGKGTAGVWNTFLHRLGIRVTQTPASERGGAVFGEMAQILRDGYWIEEDNLHLPGLLEGLAIYLRKPVTVTRLGYNYLLPDDQGDIDGDYPNQMRYLLQKVGNNSFTNLPLNAGFSHIRTSLGLPAVDPAIRIALDIGNEIDKELYKDFQWLVKTLIKIGAGGYAVIQTLNALVQKYLPLDDETTEAESSSPGE